MEWDAPELETGFGWAHCVALGSHPIWTWFSVLQKRQESRMISRRMDTRPLIQMQVEVEVEVDRLGAARVVVRLALPLKRICMWCSGTGQVASLSTKMQGKKMRVALADEALRVRIRVALHKTATTRGRLGVSYIRVDVENSTGRRTCTDHRNPSWRSKTFRSGLKSEEGTVLTVGRREPVASTTSAHMLTNLTHARWRL